MPHTSHQPVITQETEATDVPILTPASAVAPGILEQESRESPISWLDFQNPEYANNVTQWAFAQAHYTADLLLPDQIQQFLIQRSSGESEHAYDERQRLADYTPHFGAVVDSLAGMLFQVESRAERRFGLSGTTGLGDPIDPATPIGRLWTDIDGTGTNYLTFWKRLAIDLIVFHLTWCIVDTDETGEMARVKSWPAVAVPNWRYEGDRLVEVLVQEQADSRSSIEDQPNPTPRWVLYDLMGWKRFTKTEKGEPLLMDQMEYDFRDPSDQRILPVFPINLPMKRNIGYIMARKANVIFNKESERDHLLRVANFPFLNIIADDETFEAIIRKMQSGYRVLQNDPANRGKSHHFIAPSAESAEVASKVLERKVDEFWITAFREYSDSAQERTTATEIRQDVSAGVGSFLQMLKAGVDEAENQTLLRVAQIELPNNKAAWFVNTVQRSEDFVPIDIQAEIDQLRKRYFGETATVPTGRTGKVQAAKKIADWDGIETVEVELSAAVDLHILKENLEPFRELPVPPQVKAEFTVRLMVANGIIDPDEEVELDDGEKRLLVDLVREQAEVIAESLDATRSAMAQPLTEPGGNGDD